MADNNEVEYGVEKENSAVPGDEADVYAYVDDGEYATVWAINRTSDYEVAVSAYRLEAGLADRDGEYGRRYFEVDPDETAEQWARDYAKAHKTSVDVARDYWA